MTRITGIGLTAVAALLGVALPVAAASQYGTTVAGGNGFGDAANQLHGPYGVTIDGAGYVYVADTSNARVQRFPPGSTSQTDGTTVAGGNGRGVARNQLYNPSGVAVDGSDNVYVADSFNNRVQKWAPGATSGTTVAGGNGPGDAPNQLNEPSGVAVDGSGNVYVADSNNDRVQMFPPGSTSETEGITVAGGNGYGNAANQLSYPREVAVDGAGNVYVADMFNHRVQLWEPDAIDGVTVAGGNGRGSSPTQLSWPAGLVLDGVANLFVADTSNQRVQMFPPGSTSETEGITVAGGNGYGNAANQLRGPFGVTVNENDDVFVADTYNDRIQLWPSIGWPITVPGAPTGVVATRGNGSLSVAFSAPASDGGSAITSYSVSCGSSNGGVSGSATGSVSPIAVAGLTNGKSYTCRVRATNAAGTGPESVPSASVVPATVPGAPTGVVTRSGYTTTGTGPLQVSFTAPAATGGSAITSYQASCSSSNGGVARTGTGTGSPLVVSGATTGKLYACKVRAFNAVGAGGWSAVSAAIIEGAPQAPSVTGVTRPAAGQLRVAYAVNGNNGSGFTGFTAACSSSNGGAARSKTVMVGTQRAITVTGLTVGKTYRCTVKAINARGTGPASSPSAAKTA